MPPTGEEVRGIVCDLEKSLSHIKEHSSLYTMRPAM